MGRLKQLRCYHGFSQDSLAMRLGVHRNTVANWEDKGDMPLSKAIELASLFGVPVESLSVGSESVEPTEPAGVA